VDRQIPERRRHEERHHDHHLACIVSPVVSCRVR
jgi:hypothetical protein